MHDTPSPLNFGAGVGVRLHVGYRSLHISQKSVFAGCHSGQRNLGIPKYTPIGSKLLLEDPCTVTMLLLRIVIPAAILLNQPHCHALTRDVFPASEEWDKKTARERVGENRKGKIFHPSSSPPWLFAPGPFCARPIHPWRKRFQYRITNEQSPVHDKSKNLPYLLTFFFGFGSSKGKLFLTVTWCLIGTWIFKLDHN